MQEYTNHSDTTFALRNISFRVPGRTLLHPLSLTFPAGKVTGLIGHNGSGKSTLLKMLGRHQPPSEGEILLDAQPLESWSSKAFARKVAYLPQQLPPAEGMTVRELVAIGRYPWHGALGRFGAADREKVEEAISLVGLKPLAHRLVDSLSGGERQRAWIAMLVAQDSRCLLLDEPTSALDPEMVGIGPFIPQHDTPFGGEAAGTLEETLFLLGLLRLLKPKVLLPATTALGTIHPMGRELGILAGGNVVMPNLSPVGVRAKYMLYDNKICTGDEAAECINCMKRRMESIGYEVVIDRGDYKG